MNSRIAVLEGVVDPVEETGDPPAVRIAAGGDIVTEGEVDVLTGADDQTVAGKREGVVFLGLVVPTGHQLDGMGIGERLLEVCVDVGRGIEPCRFPVGAFSYRGSLHRRSGR